MLLRVTVGVFLGLGLCSVYGQGLKELEAFWVKNLAEVDKAAAETRQGRPLAYENALERMFQKVRGAGELDAALAVKKEIARFEVARKVVSTDVVSEPAGLRTLQEAWIRTAVDDQRTHAKKVIRLSEQYTEALDKLQKRLTVDNRLDEAVKVKTVKASVPGIDAVKRASFILAESGVVDAATPPVAPRVDPTPARAPPVGRAERGLLIHFPFDGKGEAFGKELVSGASAGLTSVVPTKGKTGTGAAQFDGKGSAVSIPDDRLAGGFPSQSKGRGTSFSISAWIRLDRDGVRNPIVGKQANEQRGFMFSVEKNNQLAIEVFAGPDQKSSVHSTDTLKSGRWYHVATTYASKGNGRSEIGLYLDGQSVGSETKAVGPLQKNQAPLTVGRYHWNKSYQVSMAGTIDEVRVYDRALTASEVRRLASR